MVLQYLVVAAGETAARFVVARIVDKIGGKDTITKLEADRFNAERDAMKEQIAALSQINQAEAAPVPGAASAPTDVPCPSCSLYEEMALCQSYAATIVQHCGDTDAIPTGYGGTVVQVREHLTNAIAAAHRLNEKPQFAQAGAMVAQGLTGISQSLQGAQVNCSQVKAVLPSLQEALGVADRIAVLWWQKPEEGAAGTAHPG